MKYVLSIFLLCCGMIQAAEDAPPSLTRPQSEAFRLWFMRVITEQFRQGPSPRWVQRDCAGLVRFAAHEAFTLHDDRWLKANGVALPIPPEVGLTPEQAELPNTWAQIGAEARDAYASAIAIIQANSRFVSQDVNDALPGDLLFFDQGEDRHLMVWMGSYIAYHTGRETERETGLRRVALDEFMRWKDTRWRPNADNPNFIGVFRLQFLTP